MKKIYKKISLLIGAYRPTGSAEFHSKALKLSMSLTHLEYMYVVV